MRKLLFLLLVPLLALSCAPNKVSWHSTEGKLDMSLIFGSEGTSFALSPGKVWFEEVSEGDVIEGTFFVTNNESLDELLRVSIRRPDYLDKGYVALPLGDSDLLDETILVPSGETVPVPFSIEVNWPPTSNYVFWVSLMRGSSVGSGVSVKLEVCSKVYIDMNREEG